MLQIVTIIINFFLERTFYLIADFVNVTFFGHNHKHSHRRHVFLSGLTNNISHRIYWQSTFMIHLHTKFQTPIANSSLVIAIKTKVK
jgi:hypothetical protein